MEGQQERTAELEPHSINEVLTTETTILIGLKLWGLGNMKLSVVKLGGSQANWDYWFYNWEPRGVIHPKVG